MHQDNQPKPALLNWLKDAVDPSLTDVNLLQTLWSGYGQCLRAYSPALQCSLVAKIVVPCDIHSHPRGWSGQTSHLRKLHSYQVESWFYQEYQRRLSGSVHTAALIHHEQRGEELLLVLEDLDVRGFTQRPARLTARQCYPAIQWLASFHAQFLNSPGSGLWERGTYWQLETRQKEWQALPPGRLKTHAQGIHQALLKCPFQTLVHGDAKLANFCFASDFCAAAAVDFQYCGQGTGVQDLAYFLGSALDEPALKEHESELLNYYFSVLKQTATAMHDSVLADNLIKHWRELYPYACADFCRFLGGWSPNHWKLNSWLLKHTETTLTQFEKQI